MDDSLGRCWNNTRYTKQGFSLFLNDVRPKILNNEGSITANKSINGINNVTQMKGLMKNNLG
jgi:hypothetical protein